VCVPHCGAVNAHIACQEASPYAVPGAKRTRGTR
jgi:hypothetical protein